MSIFDTNFGFAVDLDETVSATAHKWIEILSKKYGRGDAADLELSSHEMFEKYGYVQNVPYWQSEEIQDWIEKARLDPDLTLNYELMEGALEGLWTLNEMIPIKCYWSARCESLSLSTSRWLENSDLPSAELLLKPSQISFEDANQWKVDTIVEMYPHISGVIDNSSDVVSRFPGHYRGTIFHYGSEELVRDDLNVVPCANWNDLAIAVESERGNLTPGKLEP